LAHELSEPILEDDELHDLFDDGAVFVAEAVDILDLLEEIEVGDGHLGCILRGSLRQVVEGDLEGICELDEDLAGGDVDVAFVARDLFLSHADPLGELLLGPAAALAEMADPLTEGHDFVVVGSHTIHNKNILAAKPSVVEGKPVGKGLTAKPKSNRISHKRLEDFMVRIPKNELERLKAEVDLAELVRSSGVELKARGKDLVGLCPFHEEKEPSFVISPEKNLFHCLGCGAGGSVIDWVMKSEGVSFRHAVELLREGQAGGGGLRPVKRSTVRRLPPPVELEAADHELLVQVVDFYHRTLKDSAEALAYLKRRGLDDPAAIDRFRLGYANRTLGLRLPNSQRKAGREIRGRLVKLGIFRSSGHEHLAGSLVIPVFDPEGRVGELYGRKIHTNLRRGTPAHLYLPGPHRGVWNLDAFRASKEIILCESLIDALTFWCAGYRHVTASYGTNGFTGEMLEAMKAFAIERVLIAYDRDEAGEEAAVELAEKLAGEGISCFRVLFPKGMDANEYACHVTPPAKSLGLLLRSARHVAGPTTTVVQVSDPGVSSLAAEEGAAQEENRGPAPLVPSSPEPPAPRLDVPASVSEHEIVITLGDRRWRVRGLGRNMSYEQLRVNVLVSLAGAEAFHVDTFDLYSARHRAGFIKQAAAELGVKEDVVKKDLGRVLLKLEELQEEQIRAALEPKEKTIAIGDAEREAALELLKDPKLLDRVVGDLEACGLVGEETNKLTAYLAATSRKLAEPLAVLIQSSSAAGKSALMNAVLQLMPAEERVAYSAMTGQSLLHGGGGSQAQGAGDRRGGGGGAGELRLEAPAIRG